MHVAPRSSPDPFTKVSSLKIIRYLSRTFGLFSFELLAAAFDGCTHGQVEEVGEVKTKMTEAVELCRVQSLPSTKSEVPLTAQVRSGTLV